MQRLHSHHGLLRALGARLGVTDGNLVRRGRVAHDASQDRAGKACDDRVLDAWGRSHFSRHGRVHDLAVCFAGERAHREARRDACGQVAFQRQRQDTRRGGGPIGGDRGLDGCRHAACLVVHVVAGIDRRGERGEGHRARGVLDCVRYLGQDRGRSVRDRWRLAHAARHRDLGEHPDQVTAPVRELLHEGVVGHGRQQRAVAIQRLDEVLDPGVVRRGRRLAGHDAGGKIVGRGKSAQHPVDCAAGTDKRARDALGERLRQRRDGFQVRVDPVLCA